MASDEKHEFSDYIAYHITLMLTVTTIKALAEWRAKNSSPSVRIGFVPTMGALHQGHTSLIDESVAENDFTVCSIFVNPIQFNNPSDLEKYPRMAEDDAVMLEESGCDLLFMPDISEIYPEKVSKEYDFGHLDKVMEGAFRPGHFNGVAIVVDRLFRLVDPHRAYFGLKDYQQLLVIREMVKQENHSVEIKGCPIIREPDGLAMSSRNMRLTSIQRKYAHLIYDSLKYAADHYQEHSVLSLKKRVVQRMNSIPDTKLEYVEFADATTLVPVVNWSDAGHCVVCVAIYFGDVRLIDNMMLY